MFFQEKVRKHWTSSLLENYENEINRLLDLKKLYKSLTAKFYKMEISQKLRVQINIK